MPIPTHTPTPTAPPLAPPAISVTDLRKSYGTQTVLDGVTLEVPAGTVLALLGANGAGKTTLVRILATTLRPDGGQAAVAGHDVLAEDGRVRAALSLTGQFAAVDGVLTGRENLVLIARLRHLPDPDAVADGLLRRFDLVEAGRRRVAAYSGGMRRRLDIAMSLVGDPPVLVLDEPTTGLDPQSRKEVWQMVRELADRGTSVLLTTQYLQEAEHLADRIAILHDGRIIADGTLADLTALLPPARVEYVQKQPTLEDIFLAVVNGTAGSRQADR